MAKRKAISKKLRFEVFKRDSFKCQYCGAAAPDVLLQADHIKPVKDGGLTDITNLITSCSDCNSGKGARSLSDKSVVEKQRKQLEELSERREQLKMMMEWRDELLKIDQEKVDYIREMFEQLADCCISESGIKTLAKIIKKYPINIVLDSIEASTSQYLVSKNKGSGYTKESQNKAFDYIEKICACKARVAKNPDIAELYYLCGILKYRTYNLDKKEAFTLLSQAYELGTTIDELKFIVKKVRNWYDFRNAMEEIIGY